MAPKRVKVEKTKEKKTQRSTESVTEDLELLYLFFREFVDAHMNTATAREVADSTGDTAGKVSQRLLRLVRRLNGRFPQSPVRAAASRASAVRKQETWLKRHKIDKRTSKQPTTEKVKKTKTKNVMTKMEEGDEEEDDDTNTDIEESNLLNEPGMKKGNNDEDDDEGMGGGGRVGAEIAVDA